MNSNTESKPKIGQIWVKHNTHDDAFLITSSEFEHEGRKAFRTLQLTHHRNTTFKFAFPNSIPRLGLYFSQDHITFSDTFERFQYEHIKDATLLTE